MQKKEGRKKKYRRKQKWTKKKERGRAWTRRHEEGRENGGEEKEKKIKRELGVFTSSLVYFLMTFLDPGSHKVKSESITQNFKFPLK